MSKIHYFQRYSNKENVITNNTIHLLMRIYHESPRVFENILKNICGEKSENILEIGPSFGQQTGGKASIPDGKIYQKEFKLLIETKRDDNFDIKQLKEHMDGFSGTENNILLGVCRSDRTPQITKEDLVKEALAKNGRFEIVTFSKIISICRDHIPDFRLDLNEMLDDFEEFCDSEGVLEPNEDVLLVFPCSDSYLLNIQYSLYYCHKNKVPKRTVQYVGFYSKKSVRGIGHFTRSTTVDVMYKKQKITDVLQDSQIVFELRAGNPDLELVAEDGLPISPIDHTKIIDFMRDSLVQWGWQICNDHAFYFLDDVRVSDFRKINPYPLQHFRYFNLTDYISSWSKTMTIQDIVNALNASGWT